MRRVITTLLLATACIAASPDAGPPAVHVDTLPGGLISIHSDRPAWRDSLDAWSLVEEVRYGGDDGTIGELVDPLSFIADEGGRLYVVDRKPAIVKVYGPDGSFLRTIGREGSGPGEFRVGFIAVRGDRIALHDPEEGRTTVFDTSCAFVKSAVTFCCISPFAFLRRAGMTRNPSVAITPAIRIPVTSAAAVDAAIVTIVQTRNCTRSATTAPPVIMRSPTDGSVPAGPFVPLIAPMAADNTPVPALMPMIPGRPPGTSGRSSFPWTSDRENARKRYPRMPAAVQR